ncbi:MAG: histidine triad nucleotide-binding protein [Patescibacteria group bacterium]
MISDVFCKIIKGDLPAEVIYKDDDFLVIKDINPQAPVHLLIIPKKHFDSLEDFMDPVRSRARDRVASPKDRGAATSNGMEERNLALLGKALVVSHKVSHQLGIAEKGYRLIINEGEYGGKLVPHLHIHLLGGKRLGPKLVK